MGTRSQAAATDDQGPGDVTPATDVSAEGGPTCGLVPTVGCCDGETLWWCAKGVLQSKSCAKQLNCGWSNSKIYDCNTSGVADPSGKHFRQCKALTGDGSVPASDATKITDGGGCQGIKQEGCCAGNTLKYCRDGELKVLRCQQNPRCGWLANGQYYDCGTAGASDPAGVFPRACPGTTPEDLGPDQTPDGMGDAIGDMAGDRTGKGGGCTCAAGRGQFPVLLMFLMLLLVRGRRRL